MVGPTHVDFDGQPAAVVTLRLDELGSCVDERVGNSIGQCVKRRSGRREPRDEACDVVTHDRLERRSEQAYGGCVGFEHRAFPIDGQDGVLDMVEDGMKGRKRLSAPRRVVAEDLSEVVANRRALESLGNPPLEAVLRHAEFPSAGRGFTGGMLRTARLGTP